MTGRIIFDEPPAEYYKRSLEVVSNSTLVIADSQSLAKYHYYVTQGKDEDTEAKAIGKAYHCALLEPDTFDARHMILPPDAPSRPSARLRNAKKPSASTLAAIDFWDEIIASGKQVLKREDYDTVRFMGDAVRKDPVCAGLVSGGRREVTLRWTEEVELEDGSIYHLQHKGRVDNWLDDMDIAVDPKSTISAHPEEFAKAVARYRMHQQHAQYCSGFQHCDRPLKAFIFLAQEKEPPYICKPYTVNPVFEERGFELRARAMRKVAGALRENRWPGYVTRNSRGEPTAIGELNPPAWALYDIESI